MQHSLRLLRCPLHRLAEVVRTMRRPLAEVTCPHAPGHRMPNGMLNDCTHSNVSCMHGLRMHPATGCTTTALRALLSALLPTLLAARRPSALRSESFTAAVS